jgi:hypothetical protein
MLTLDARAAWRAAVFSELRQPRATPTARSRLTVSKSPRRRRTICSVGHIKARLVVPFQVGIALGAAPVGDYMHAVPMASFPTD